MKGKDEFGNPIWVPPDPSVHGRYGEGEDGRLQP